MARKIIDQLFKEPGGLSSESKQQEATEEAMFVSMKDWKILMSRLDNTQAQVSSCDEKVNFMYSKVMKWLGQVREKLSAVSKMQAEADSHLKQNFKAWEKRVLDWVQPHQRKEDQRKVMDLMHRHSQFIQSYDKQVDAVKKALSKNEYEIYRVLEQMRTLRVEMDLINREGRQERQRAESRI